MPPQRARKQKSASSTASTTSPQIIGPQLLPLKDDSPKRLPVRSPIKQPMLISQSQKEALMDNLQLEITERARKLRSQYALQAQGLRTRLEIRVHRIPAALRKTTIGELLEKYSDKADITTSTKVKQSALSLASPPKVRNAVNHIEASIQAGRLDFPQTSLKRKSDHMEANKENAVQEQPDSPAKRPRTNAVSASGIWNNTSKCSIPASQILSPKSNNSRTLLQSPFKHGLASPIKSNIARPISPLKPSAAAPNAISLAKASGKKGTTRSKTTSTTARSTSRRVAPVPGTDRTKRGAATLAQQPPRLVTAEDEDPNRHSNVSQATSAGTTIVRKVKKSGPVPTKKPLPSTSSVGKERRLDTVTKQDTNGTVRAGRTLRKRA